MKANTSKILSFLDFWFSDFYLYRKLTKGKYEWYKCSNGMETWWLRDDDKLFEKLKKIEEELYGSKSSYAHNSNNKQMKLIKLSSDHYIIVDDSEIKEGDYVINIQRLHIYPTPVSADDVEYRNRRNDVFKKITHSTQPLEDIEVDKYVPRMSIYEKILQLSLSEVKELLGEVDVEKKALRPAAEYKGWYKEANTYDFRKGYEVGYREALEDNKDRKYTEEDMIRAYRQGGNNGAAFEAIVQHDYKDAVRFEKANDKKFMSSLQPPTSWEVEFVNGKLKIV